MAKGEGNLEELKKEGEEGFKPMIERGEAISSLSSILALDTTDKDMDMSGFSRFGAFMQENFEPQADGSLKVKTTKEGRPLVEVCGKFLARKVVDGKVKIGLIECKDTDAFCKATQRTMKLRESLFGDDGFASGEGNALSGNIEIAKGDLEYTPFMSGAFNKQLYMYDYNVMHSRAWEMWNHNPVAHQIVKITTFFVLGRGVAVRMKDADAQKVWDDFCKKTDFYDRIKTWCDMLTRDGELMVRTFKDKTGMNGDVIVRAMDPSTVWEIITDPEDIEKVYYYHQQYPTQYQVFYNPNPLQIASTKYVINQIPATDIKHYKINSNANEKRGRSDLFCIMTWLKRHKDFYTARTIRGIMQSTFVWKMILQGSDADVQNAKNVWGSNPPKSGTIWFENQSATLTPMAIDLKAADARDDGDALLNMCSIGSGIPKEYLGLGDKSTKATALVASEPGAKKFQDRQDLFKKIIGDVIDTVMTQAQRAGTLPQSKKEMPEGVVSRIIQALKSRDFWTALQLLGTMMKGGTTVTVDKSYEIIMPEIAIEDRSAKIKDLTLMQVNGWVSKKTAGQIAAKEMHLDQYDFEEEQNQIKTEAKSGEGQTELVPAVNPATGAIKFDAKVGGPSAVQAQAINPEAPKTGIDRSAIKDDAKI